MTPSSYLLGWVNKTFMAKCECVSATRQKQDRLSGFYIICDFLVYKDQYKLCETLSINVEFLKRPLCQFST